MMEKRKKNITLHRPVLVALLLASFALGVFIDRGFMVVSGGPAEDTEGRSVSGLAAANRSMSALESSVSAAVKQKLADHEANALSIYFYDFRNNTDFGIGEELKFFPHSLLKLPVMLVYFKQAGTNPDLLQKKLVYKGPRQGEEPPLIKPVRTLKPGADYTVQDLIYRMLVYGDDEAFLLLNSELPEGALDHLYADLSLEYDPASDDDPMSLKDYAAFFRALYNGTYLNKRMTSRALNYLSQSSFRNGMVAGIPPNIRIASRFGAHIAPAGEKNEPKDLVQLHEVGIIYYPDRPFLLGVSIEGTDLSRLERTVRDLSRSVYHEVEHQQKERNP